MNAVIFVRFSSSNLFHDKYLIPQESLCETRLDVQVFMRCAGSARTRAGLPSKNLIKERSTDGGSSDSLHKSMEADSG